MSDTNIVTKNVSGVNKKYIKGERLKFYPTGMPLYSCSRGMKRPTVESVVNKDIKDKLKNYYMSFRQSFIIGDKEKGNIVDKRYYKKKGTGSSRKLVKVIYSMLKNKTSYAMPEVLGSKEDKVSDSCDVTKEAS